MAKANGVCPAHVCRSGIGCAASQAFARPAACGRNIVIAMRSNHTAHAASRRHGLSFKKRIDPEPAPNAFVNARSDHPPARPAQVSVPQKPRAHTMLGRWIERKWLLINRTRRNLQPGAALE